MNSPTPTQTEKETQQPTVMYHSERETDWGYTEPRGAGWILFSSIMLSISGIFNIIYGITGLARSVFFVDGSRFIAGDLRAWAWTILALGVVEVIASGSLLIRSQWARWFAISMAALTMIANMIAIQAYPFWSLLFIGLNILVIYGLARYGGRLRHTDYA